MRVITKQLVIHGLLFQTCIFRLFYSTKFKGKDGKLIFIRRANPRCRIRSLVSFAGNLRPTELMTHCLLFSSINF